MAWQWSGVSTPATGDVEAPAGGRTGRLDLTAPFRPSTICITLTSPAAAGRACLQAARRSDRRRPRADGPPAWPGLAWPALVAALARPCPASWPTAGPTGAARPPAHRDEEEGRGGRREEDGCGDWGGWQARLTPVNAPSYWYGGEEKSLRSRNRCLVQRERHTHTENSIEQRWPSSCGRASVTNVILYCLYCY